MRRMDHRDPDLRRGGRDPESPRRKPGRCRRPLPRYLPYRYRALFSDVPSFSWAKGLDHKRRVPSSLPLPGASLRSRIKWWEDVLAWLRDLIEAIEESLNKDLDDLSALLRASGDQRSASFAMLTLDLVQKPAGPLPAVVDGYAADDVKYEAKRPSCVPYEKLTPWGRWEQQQEDLHTCQLKKLFYGPRSLPSEIVIPSSNEMVEISAFVEAHKCYVFKYWEYLEHLLDLVGYTLTPQVESKLEDLRNELELKELGVWLPQ